MDMTKAETLAGYRRRMVESAPWAEGMLGKLERDGFVVNHIRPHAAHVWFMRVAPPAEIQAGFGIAPELLIVVDEGELKARTLHAASEEVVRSELRLDGNIVIFSDQGTTPLRERLERIGGHGQRIPWIPTATGEWPPLREVLRSTLPAFDAYEERDPVRGAQLVGRDAEVSELRTRMVRGDAVGLFGLRKMGKSSVMRAVTDWFDPASGAHYGDIASAEAGNIAVVIDAGVLIERTVEELATELLRELDRRMRVAKERMPHRQGSGLSQWKSAIEGLLDQERRLCIAIDEYDLLFEGEGGTGPIPGLNQFFRLVRGWSQMHQGQVSLLLVGRDSTFLATPELDGVTNALLMWCTPMWIGPLAPLKATELLRKIGKRVGLSVGHETTRLALEWTGGHPLLQRQFGSALRAVVRDHDDSWGAATDPYLPMGLERYKSRDAVQEVLREIASLLKKRHSRAYDLLAELAQGRGWNEVTSRDRGPDEEAAIRILLNFGLARKDHTMAETLRWYFRNIIPVLPPLRRTA